MPPRFISEQSLKDRAIERRLEDERKKAPSIQRDARIAELEDGKIPSMRFKEGVDPKTIFKPGRMIGGKVSEFATTGDYAAAWYTRQRYELDAGRDSAPLLYTSIYDVTVDPNLSLAVDINTINPNGFVFTPVAEGEEMKFTQVGSGQYSIRLERAAVGVEYTEELFMSNQFYRVSNFERYAAIGHNAYANYMHFEPIINPAIAYAGNNVFDGTALTNFAVTDPLALKYQRALEGAVKQARSVDVKMPGSYALLIGSDSSFEMERALLPVQQQGFSVQSPTLNAAIRSVIVYDGWSGTRGKKDYTYSGVQEGYAYLIDLSRREIDFQSYWKWMLRLRQGDPDLSRNIEAQAFWDSYFGLYANVTDAVIKIELPTAADGAS